MFTYFETCSAAERDTIAAKLTDLYNTFYKRENEKFLSLREAKTPKKYRAAQLEDIAANSAIGAIQAVFYELGIEFPAQY